MKSKEIKSLFELEHSNNLRNLQEKKEKLEKLFKRTKIKEKLNLIGKEIDNINQTRNFLIVLYQGQFNREFLHLMFDCYNPFLNYYQLQKDLMEWIRMNKHRYTIKNGKSKFTLIMAKVIMDEIKNEPKN